MNEGLRSTWRTASLLAIMAAFQGCLASGAPWGRAAYGGVHAGRLPPRLRLVSGAACLGYGAATASLVNPRTPRARRMTLAGCVAVGSIATPVNALSPSRSERTWALWSAALVASAASDRRR